MPRHSPHQPRGVAHWVLYRSSHLSGRILLTAVVGVDPPAGSHSASVAADLVATFDQNISPATATWENLVVHSSRRGQLTNSSAIVTSVGAEVTFDPTPDFLPGEMVQATVTSAIESSAGATAQPHVWTFRTRVPAGSGTLVDSSQFLGNHSSADVVLGDLDGDGDLDAFVSNYFGQANRVWLNRNGRFSDSGQQLGNYDSRGLALGDIDGDGDLDAVVANHLQANRVWRNDGSGRFTHAQDLGTADSLDVALGDLDGDGDLDAFVANPGDGQGDGNRVWLNQSGVFTDSGQSLGNHVSKGLALGDLDNDGDLDAVVANSGGNRVWLNGGAAQFSSNGQSLGNNSSYNVALGDLDGDKRFGRVLWPTSATRRIASGSTVAVSSATAARLWAITTPAMLP